MSLNGLDSPAVQEAYQVAVVEVGGWFLLKYTSRDSVELLARGKNGVHEARYAIAKYDEPSPLYGLIIYRRRKVLIKYIPEGTSRLLKARTAVHFQDVTERYAPYETLLEITTAEGLSDTSLAASFPLHTASPSASSSRLHEISEDGEEGGQVSRRSINPRSTASGAALGTQRHKTERRVDEIMRSERSPPPPSIQVNGDGMQPVSPISSPLSSPKKTSVSHFLVHEDSGHRSITSLGTPSIASLTEYKASEASSTDKETVPGTVDPPKANSPTSPTSPTMKPLPKEPPVQSEPPRIPEKSAARHVSSNSAEKELPNMSSAPSMHHSISDERPNTSERLQYDEDPYDFSKFDSIFKPKVKLGPRPVAVGEKAKRPATASISVPATYKPTMKKQEPARPASQQVSRAVTTPAPPPTLSVLPTPPPIPNLPEYNPRPLSRGSVKSLPSHKSTAMTPDKIRLMKAVELRKKQLRKSNPQPQTYTPSQGEETPAVPSLPEQSSNQPTAKAPEKTILTEMGLRDSEETPSKKADSGIEMVYDKTDNQDAKKDAEEPREQELERDPIVPQRVIERDVVVPPSPRTPKQDAFPVTAAEDAPHAQPAQSPSPEVSMVKRSSKAPTYKDESALNSPVFDRPFEDADLANLLPEESANVPRIVMADGSRLISSNVPQSKPDDDSDIDSDAESTSSDDSMTNSGVLRQQDMSPRRQKSDLARRRRGFVEPLHVDGEELNSDDDFMEELQTATLQQAKPMTVAKSPVTPFFQRRPSANSAVSDGDSMTLTNAFTEVPGRFSPDSTAEDHTRSRSVSGEKNDSMAGLKRNVSSGISKRIQALAEVSSRETSPQGHTMPGRPITPEMWDNGFLQKDQRELRSSMRSPPPKSRTASFKSAARLSSRMSSYDRKPSANSIHQSEKAPAWNVQQDATANPDSVSVTARIVRPMMDESADFANQMDQTFQQSDLVISHTRTSETQGSAPQLPRLDTNPTPQPPSRSTTPSMSPTFTRGSTDGSRQLHSAYRNMGRRKAALSPTTPIADDFPPPPNHGIHSSTSLASNDENNVPKEGTRTSRFFKRMSNIGSKRRSAAQQSHGSSSPSDGASLIVHNASLASKDRSDMPPAVIVGDLNVQFPDTLLWKRRIVEIDESGYLIFSIPQAMDHQRGAANKYPLSDFRMPYVPDLDRQELPNSVMLDFLDGTTLQAACEDTMTHQQVAHVLKSYWRAWAGP